MPRTKASALSESTAENVKPSAYKLHQHMRNTYLKSLEAAAIKADKEIESERSQIMLKCHITLKEQFLSFPHNCLSKTLAELKIDKPDYTTICEISSFKNVTASTSRNRRNTKHQEETKDMSMRPKLQTTIKKAKITRSSRSLSRSKIQQALNSFATPLHQNIPHASSFGLVTPKVKPNTPQIVLRRPKEGELALSMQGSPLMVSGMTNERRANVNIPLPDGRIISIQPQRGLRTSQIPDMDEETKRQIETLRDNLNKVCAFSNRN